MGRERGRRKKKGNGKTYCRIGERDERGIWEGKDGQDKKGERQRNKKESEARKDQACEVERAEGGIGSEDMQKGSRDERALKEGKIMRRERGA